MKSAQNAWNNFEASGKIEDYLKYCAQAHRDTEQSEGDAQYAALNRRDHSAQQNIGKR